MEYSILDELLPYNDWRPGQRELAKIVEETVLDSKILLARYPIGLGKTIAVLVGAIASGIPKIIYLARTKNQFQAPFRELARLAASKINIPAVMLVNKKELCLLPISDDMSYRDFLVFCSKARKSGQCRYRSNALPEETPLLVDVNTAKLLGKKLLACPFEISWKLISRSRVIVASYSYLFDPDLFKVFLSKSNIKLEEALLVVDEAHNLPSYIASISQATLDEYTLIMSRKEIQTLKTPKTNSVLNRISMFITYIRKKSKQSNETEKEIDISEALSILPSSKDLYYIASLLEENNILETSYTRKVADFVSMLEKASHDHLLSLRDTSLGFEVNLIAYNVSRIAQSVFSKIRSAVLMSATLPPKEYMVALLGLTNRAIDEVVYPYLWAENASINIVRGLTSRYVEREKMTFKKYAQFIDYIFSKNGNTLTVFPSYSFLKNVYAHISSTPTIVEDQHTVLKNVINILLKNEKTLILAVAWGKLVEGIEFRNRGKSLLDTIIIAGLPVPEPSLYNKKLLNYLTLKLGNRDKAWKIVYLYPGLMKIVQAIGRGIRSEKDKIKVYILDDRVLSEGVDYLLSYGFRINIVELDEIFGFDKEQ